jgi:hypothetical protein
VRARSTAALVVATAALAGCGGSGGGLVKSVPYPSGPWSAGDQGTFIGACTSEGASDSYCICALGSVMEQYPDTHNLPGSILAGGTTAAQKKNLFPSCQGK